MSALWRFAVTLIVVFCISVSTTSCSTVKWKKPGMSVTIQCNCGKKDIKFISVKKGLYKNESFYYKTPSHTNSLYPQRSEDNGHFPNIQILLKNLTREDTGVYWCMCGTHSAETGLNVPDGDGSVLLVVADPAAGADSSKASACGEDDTEVDNHLLLITVVISSVLVLVIFSALLLLAIRKVTVSHDGKKPRAIPRNDVYEEMRVSIRR
ncbi:unnamed protein product [Knipowitschia caucasica]